VNSGKKKRKKIKKNALLWDESGVIYINNDSMILKPENTGNVFFL